MFKPKPFKKFSSSISENKISIEKLYPDLTPEQHAEAEFFLMRYLEIVRRIFERTKNLTKSDKSDRV